MDEKKKIQAGKYYEEYTEEELKQLPPLKAEPKFNWAWSGNQWEFCPRD